MSCLKWADIFLESQKYTPRASEKNFRLECKVWSPKCFFHSFIYLKISASGQRVWRVRFSDALSPSVEPSLLQCKPDISRSRISRNWIYRGRMLDPIFWRPRARYLTRNRSNSLDPIRGRQFFAKSAHRDSLCSRFAGDNFSRNQLKPTCQCGLEHMLCDGQPR